MSCYKYFHNNEWNSAAVVSKFKQKDEKNHWTLP